MFFDLFIFVGTLVVSECGTVVSRQYTQTWIKSSSYSRVPIYDTNELSALKCGVACNSFAPCQVFVYSKDDGRCIAFRNAPVSSKISELKNAKIFTATGAGKSRPVTRTIHGRRDKHTVKRCYSPTVAHAVTAGKEHWDVGETVSYEFDCDQRYSSCLKDTHPVIRCLPTGRWSKPTGCHRLQYKQNELPAIIHLTCPASNGSVILIQGKLTEVSKTAQVGCYFKGNSGVLSHTFMPRSVGVQLNGEFLLRYKPKVTDRHWRLLVNDTDAFRVRDANTFNLKFSIVRNSIKIELNKELITLYQIPREISVHKIQVVYGMKPVSIQIVYP